MPPDKIIHRALEASERYISTVRGPFNIIEAVK